MLLSATPGDAGYSITVQYNGTFCDDGHVLSPAPSATAATTHVTRATGQLQCGSCAWGTGLLISFILINWNVNCHTWPVLLDNTDLLRKRHEPTLWFGFFQWTSLYLGVMPLLPLRESLENLICHGDVIGDCLQYPSLLLLRKPGVVSFRALFEEWTYFLLISNGIIHIRHVFIFALAARKPTGNSKSMTATVQSHEGYIGFPLFP